VALAIALLLFASAASVSRAALVRVHGEPVVPHHDTAGISDARLQRHGEVMFSSRAS
jgi:hypothetical protein